MQAAYFIERDLSFKRDVTLKQKFLYSFNENNFSIKIKKEEKLVKEYEKIKEPELKFVFERLIWLPKNWKIDSYMSTEGKRYTLDKYTRYESDTRYPFWRWKNFFLRTYVNFSNVFFFLGVNNFLNI